MFFVKNNKIQQDSKRFWHISVKTKLLVAIGFLVAIAVSLEVYLAYQTAYHNEKESLIRRIELLTEIESYAISPSIVSSHYQNISKLADALLRDPVIAGVLITDAENRNIYKAGSVAIDRDGDYIERFIYPPVIKEKKPIGILKIYLTFNSLEETAIRIAKDKILRGVALLVTILVCCFLVLHFALKPLHHIANIMEEFTDKGVLKEVPTYRKNDEIGKLTCCFNRMVEYVEFSKKQLEIAKDNAEQASKAKSEFLSNISYDIHKAMHFILDAVKHAIPHMPKEHAEERIMLTRSLTKGENLVSLLDDIIDISLLEEGGMEMHFEEQNIVAIIQESISAFDKVLKEKSISLLFSDPGEAVLVVCDKARIAQVLENIMANAIRYTPVRGTIEIICYGTTIETDNKKHVPAISVSVLDQGIGVSEHEVEVIFDKLIKTTSLSIEEGGTGIGLGICKEIIEIHQGKIWIENNPDRGANCTFVIPVTQKK